MNISTGRTSANSTSATPRSDASRRRAVPPPVTKSGAGVASCRSCKTESDDTLTPTACFLDRRNDRLQRRADLPTELGQNDEADDRDQEQDQRVLDERLTVFPVQVALERLEH